MGRTQDGGSYPLVVNSIWLPLLLCMMYAKTYHLTKEEQEILVFSHKEKVKSLAVADRE